MSAERLRQQYMVGDQVRMTVEIVHVMNLVCCYAVFRHETDDRVEIILSDDSPSDPKRTSGQEKRSVWYPSEMVDPKHMPGVYNLHRITLVTAAGKRIVLDAEEHLARYPERSMQVVEEPDTTPYFGAVQFGW